ncbi:hypothetical protein ABZV93_08010 [Actinopolymorpha sp. NPDC004070]|uniref:hypothetical protein n=1 Tax=Actinopolymorpha sp. NPDC004070 TaxID=3154548 RepID=UPI0033A1DFCE
MNLAPMRMHSREEFQTWLAQDLDVREELYALMGGELDVDLASLDELERFLLDRYPDPDAILALDQRGVADAAARHVGRVITLNVDDAVWDIDLDDERTAFYRLPVVRMADGYEDCPLALVTTALDRRTGTFLREHVEKLAEDYNEPE